MMAEQEKPEPDWAHRAKYIDHKPVWVDGIPDLLHELGGVFFPIPSRRKGYGYPHHLQEYRYLADSETLNAYLECGWGYGIACANNLIVLDIDEKEKVDEVTENIPESAYQISGSREGVHIFYKSPGFDTRQIIHHPTAEHDCDNNDHNCRYDQDGDCTKEKEWEHLGEIKADPHGYVIGPGSKHPSGNEYGPLRGDEIAEVDKEELLDSLDGYIKPKRGSATEPGEYIPVSETSDNRYEFYELEGGDVIPFLEPNNRVDHPVHGSTSEVGNFMLNDDRQTFTCWRHNYGGSQGCGLNAQQFLAQSEAKQNSTIGYVECDEIRMMWRNDYRLHYLGWRRAVSDGLIEVSTVPYKVVLGYAKYNDVEVDPDNMSYDEFWTYQNEIKYITLSSKSGHRAHG